MTIDTYDYWHRSWDGEEGVDYFVKHHAWARLFCRGGQFCWCHRMATLAVWVYSFLTNLAALRCTLSYLVTCSWVWGSRDTEEYSRIGRTIDLNASSFVTWGLFRRFLCRKESFEFVFLEILVTCVFQFTWLWMFTLRYFADLTVSRTWPWIDSWEVWGASI